MSDPPPGLDESSAARTSRQDGRRPWLPRLFVPVDVAFLAYFRIIFAVNMLVNLAEYIINDRIGTYFVRTSFHFKYYGFGWVEPWGWIEPLGVNGM